jgi:transposase-like protein
MVPADTPPPPVSAPAEGDGLPPAGGTGGPRTPAGKARSRGNAVRHGLTATTLLAQLLGPEAIERHRHALRTEWRPASATQEFLVAELARHAAALERAEQAELAVLRCGARRTAGVGPLVDTAGAEADVPLTGAFASKALECVTRYRASHEKAWHTALARLRECQTREGPAPAAPADGPPWATEAECATYLLARLRRPGHRCPHCSHPHGYWLAIRRRWQCAGCGRQVGLRAGTVMERSPLPLRAWFAVIWQMLADRQTPLGELAARGGVRRLATVRDMAARVGRALDAPRRTELLAGLDAVSGQRA